MNEAWIIIMKGKRDLAKSTGVFYLTEEDAHIAHGSQPWWCTYFEVVKVLVNTDADWEVCMPLPAAYNAVFSALEKTASETIKPQQLSQMRKVLESLYMAALKLENSADGTLPESENEYLRRQAAVHLDAARIWWECSPQTFFSVLNGDFSHDEEQDI